MHRMMLMQRIGLGSLVIPSEASGSPLGAGLVEGTTAWNEKNSLSRTGAVTDRLTRRRRERGVDLKRPLGTPIEGSRAAVKKGFCSSSRSYPTKPWHP